MAYSFHHTGMRKKMKQNSSKEDHSEGALKRVLARLIIEIADSIKDVKQKEILQTLARKLDMHVTHAR